MTTPAVSQRFVAGLAAAVAVARASLGHTPWDEAGIATAIREAAEHVPLVEVGIALLRAAGDPANDTPAAIQHANNRAWDSDWHLPCKTHPETRARRSNGECAACWTDRHATLRPLPLRNHGVPPTPDVRLQLVAELTPATSSDATSPGSTEVTP